MQAVPLALQSLCGVHFPALQSAQSLARHEMLLPALNQYGDVCAENGDLGAAGTLFRSLAVDSFTPEPDEDLYNPLSLQDRQTRR